MLCSNDKHSRCRQHACDALAEHLQLFPIKGSSSEPVGPATFVTPLEKGSNNYPRRKPKRGTGALVHTWVEDGTEGVKQRLNSLYSVHHRPLVTGLHLVARKVEPESVKTAKSCMHITISC